MGRKLAGVGLNRSTAFVDAAKLLAFLPAEGCQENGVTGGGGGLSH